MLRRFGLGILGAPALSFALAAVPVWAQVEMKPEAQKVYKACVGAANTHNLIQTSAGTIYTCFGEVAQEYYEYLVSVNAEQTIDKQRTGTYIFRAIPQIGRCWNKVTNIDNVTTSEYGCSLTLAKPPS
jgi:hypothetical protein